MDLMRAAVLVEPNQPMVIEEIPIPVPKRGEILIRVEACGVCHTDLHVMKGDVAFPTPCVLGHEVAGQVIGLGDDVEGIAEGDKIVTSFIMPCGTCRYCGAGRDDLCETFFAMNRLNGTLYDGESRLRRTDGTSLAMYSMAGLAEYAVTPVTAAYHRSDNLDASEAAILGCAYFTAHGAVRHRAQLVAGERVAVIGTGGVGTGIVQVAAAFGASQVIAVDLAEEKLELAKANGASDTVNASQGDPVEQVRELSEGGVDVAFEAIGLPATWVQGTQMVRDGGRFVAVGIGEGSAQAPIGITHVVRRAISVMGSYGGRARSDMPRIMRLAELGQIRPGRTITEHYSLEQAAVAYDKLERGQIAGRAVITF